MRRPSTSKRSHNVAYGSDRRRVVRVVENDLERMLVVDVHAPGRLEERRVEGPQAVANILEVDRHVVGQRRGEHRVLHVVQRAAFERGRDQVCPQQRHVRVAIVDRDHVAVHALLRARRAWPPARMCSLTSGCAGFIVT